ncbi:MAG: hypothetical protein H7Y07_08010 [Pyrinomonadaceae bacterium]|nr:hypothetical protein [Sphingobacteriaceae bacterium]
MAKKQPETAFQRAFQYLLRSGKIDKQKDIVHETGIKASQLSSYMNTNTPISKDFKIKFEEKYEIKLEDFEGDLLTENGRLLTPQKGNISEILPKAEPPPDYRDEYIALLKKNLSENEAIAHDHAKMYQDLLIRVLAIQELVLQVASGQQYGSYQAARESLSTMDDAIAREQTDGISFEKGRKGKGVAS